MPRIPILMYHQVSPRTFAEYRAYIVSPSAFAAQMRWLALARYTPIGLDQLVAHRVAGATLPERPVLITFDDGFRDCVEFAVPILQARLFTAVFYLVAGRLGATNVWDRQTVGIELPLMDWSTARALHAAGFTCGAHSVTHPPLATLPPAECWDELHRSRCMLEDGLGCLVTHFAYPYGSFDHGVRAMVAAAGYQSACSVRLGLSSEDDDIFALHRVPVLGTDTLWDFICRLHTARRTGEMLYRARRRAWSYLRRPNVERVR